MPSLAKAYIAVIATVAAAAPSRPRESTGVHQPIGRRVEENRAEHFEHAVFDAFDSRELGIFEQGSRASQARSSRKKCSRPRPLHPFPNRIDSLTRCRALAHVLYCLDSDGT